MQFWIDLQMSCAYAVAFQAPRTTPAQISVLGAGFAPSRKRSTRVCEMSVNRVGGWYSRRIPPKSRESITVDGRRQLIAA